MLAHQIVAGFSEIKSELRNQAKLSKSLDELRLWFSIDQDVFFAHDFHQHEKCIALAIFNKVENAWWITFRGGTYGKRLIEWSINKFERDDLAEKMNEQYKSHGYFTL